MNMMRCSRFIGMFLLVFMSTIYCSIAIDQNDDPYKYCIPEIKYLSEDSKTYTNEQIIQRIKDLKSEKKANSDTDEAPFSGSSAEGGKGLVTKIGVWLHADRIVKMDVEQQTLTLMVDEVIMWEDERLKWSNEKAAPVIEILLNANDIWIPPVYALDIVNEEIVHDSGMIEVDSDGLCTWKRTMMYSMPCSISVEDFPFDDHNCSFELSQLSTFHNRLAMAIIVVPRKGKRRKGDGNQFSKEQYAHLEWVKLGTDIDASRSEGESIHFSIRLHRSSKFYSIVLLFPTILLNLLSLITFTISIKNTGRTSFALTLILTYFVLVMIIVDTSPPTGNKLPRLGMYVIMCSVIVVVTFGMSLILIELHKQKIARKAKMPKWLSWFLEHYCCVDWNLKRYCQKDTKYAANEEGGNKANLLELDQHANGKPQQDCPLGIPRDEYKWKLFAKILNYGFFITTLLAHIIMPCVMFTS